MVDLVYINSVDPPFKQAVYANNNFSAIETSINSISAADIVDATTVGREVLTAASAEAAREAIGAGTSNLELGTTASTALAGNTALLEIGTTDSTAAAGNHTHTIATTQSSGFMPASAVEKLAGIQVGANKTELGLSSGKAKPGDWVPSWSDVQSKPASYAPSEHMHGTTDLLVSDTIKSILASSGVPEVRQKLNIVNPTNSFTTTTTLYSGTAEIEEAKIFTAIVNTTTPGSWAVEYSHVGFTEIFSVNAVGEAVGTALADRTIACVAKDKLTLTSCEGHLMSASSAGLLAAMTLVNGSGKVHVTVYGR